MAKGETTATRLTDLDSCHGIRTVSCRRVTESTSRPVSSAVRWEQGEITLVSDKLYVLQA